MAVIGAGVAGAFCARALADAGLTVRVFDKGRAVGGRLAQRRHGGAVFDHGAQFIRPRDPLLRALLEAGIVAGHVARWPAADHDGRPAFVGAPSMAAPLRPLLADLDVTTACRITALEPAGRGWRLRAEDGHTFGPFAQVALALPPVQAHALLVGAGTAPATLLQATEAATMAPCWAALLAFDPPLAVEGFDARPIAAGPLAWVARNTTKPGREGFDSWTVHAAADWSAAHLAEEPEVVLAALLDGFRAITGCAGALPVVAQAHRWRYAQVIRPAGAAAFHDPGSGLGLCGDWCLGGKVEAAFLSGRALAAQLCPAAR